MSPLFKASAAVRHYCSDHPVGVSLFLICLVSFATYSPLLFGTFLNFDDGQQIFDNLRVKEGGWSNFADALFTNYTGKGSAPSFAVSVLNWSVTPYYAGFAAVNLLAFMGAILIFYRFTALFISRREWRSAATLLFSVHSLNTDALGWMSSRCHLMGGVCVLCCFIFWQKYRDDLTRLRRGVWYLAALFFAALAIWNKGIFLVAPALIVAFDIYRARRLSVWAVLDKVPLFFLSLLPFQYSPLRIGGAGFARPGLGPSLSNTLMNDAGLLMEYLYRLAVPGPTVVSIDVYPVASLWEASDASSLLFMRMPPVFNIAFLALSAFLAVTALVRYRAVNFFFFFVFAGIALAPVMNIPPRWVDFGFRFALMPLFFFCVLAGAAGAALSGRLGKRGRIVLGAIFGLWVAWNATESFLQARRWNTELGYWTACTENFPDSIVCRHKAAWLSERAGRVDDAEEHYMKVHQYTLYRAPNRPRPSAKNLGALYKRLGRVEDARFYLQRSLLMDRLNRADRKWVRDTLRELSGRSSDRP